MAAPRYDFSIGVCRGDVWRQHPNVLLVDLLFDSEQLLVRKKYRPVRASSNPVKQCLTFLDSCHLHSICQQMSVLQFKRPQSQFAFDDMSDSFVADPKLLRHFLH